MVKLGEFEIFVLVLLTSIVFALCFISYRVTKDIRELQENCIQLDTTSSAGDLLYPITK